MENHRGKYRRRGLARPCSNGRKHLAVNSIRLLRRTARRALLDEPARSYAPSASSFAARRLTRTCSTSRPFEPAAILPRAPLVLFHRERNRSCGCSHAVHRSAERHRVIARLRSPVRSLRRTRARRSANCHQHENRKRHRPTRAPPPHPQHASQRQAEQQQRDAPSESARRRRD